MTLEGAIKFNEESNYIVYTMNSATTGQYCVVLPKDVSGVMNMLVDLHMKGLFDSLSTGVKTREQLLEEVGKEYVNVKTKYNNAMLVLPMIEEAGLQNAILNNDKQKMFDEVKKIGAITSEIYKKLTDSGVEKQSIDQKIIIVEKQESDEKFVSWLKEQMPNFVDGINYSSLEPKEIFVNPFMEVPIVEPINTPVNSESVSLKTASASNDIFSNVTSNENVVSVASANPVSESVVSASTQNIDIFGNASNVVGPVPTVEKSVSDTSVDPFGNVSPINQVVPNVEASTTNVVPNVSQPQPVNSVELEGTTTFSPIPDQNVVQQNNVQSLEEKVEDKKEGSKGFVNLIILVVVLVGVTVASIELGKFLYSVYGA